MTDTTFHCAACGDSLTWSFRDFHFHHSALLSTCTNTIAVAQQGVMIGTIRSDAGQPNTNM